jgi:phospholipid/cholesterol/gamma-HCH transport system permease protein
MDAPVGGLRPVASHAGEQNGTLHLGLSGDWVAVRAPELEAWTGGLVSAQSGSPVVLDLAQVARLDTLGAWLINRTRHELEARGRSTKIIHEHPEHQQLLKRAAYHDFSSTADDLAAPETLVQVGRGVIGIGRDLGSGLAFFGELVIGITQLARRQTPFRLASFVHQMELIAFRGAPIIILIAFLVGGIIAQQGIFQLQKFGATPFVVDLIGILTLREMGLLLAAIMLAGRTGSAFTAEIGSMKMREEIDAIRVMGMDPMHVLFIPRILALIVSLPMLTFLADLAALYGGILVSWRYGEIDQWVFLARLHDAIGLNTFLVGLIKAPIMALVIGVIACSEGLAVQGSAESLGRHVTTSVVKSIFMVIVMDGLFAMFFAAIEY